MFGSEEQKQRFLPRCAGGAITAFLLTEPDVGSDPARMASTATPTEDGTAYLLDGVKLWTTNGVIAELVVVMARVPEHANGRGGISAFVVDTASEGITVERRNAFMGLKGLENGVTRFHQVRVPAENRLGREGEGLKIALTTLNTGRLSIPAMCAAAGKWSLKIAREWSGERVQWGRPVGQHGAVAEKISFIAATTFGLEAVLGLSAELADAGSKDIRIEAALAKLWSSEMAWLVADELVQIRGGRGYETAASLAARGRAGGARRAGAARPADQPDLRGLHRDHAPDDRPRGGRRPPARRGRPGRRRRRPPGQGEGRRQGERFLREVAAAAGRGQGHRARGPIRSSDRSPGTCATSSGPRASWPGRPSTGCPAGRRSWSTSRGSSAGSSTSGPSCSPWPRPVPARRCSRTEHPEQGQAAYALADAFCAQARLRADHLFDRLVDQHRRQRPADRPPRPRRRVHVARGQACSTSPRAPVRGSPPGRPAPARFETVRRHYR